ncbi:GntR family transcriptional regulator [uncultured Enterovirga sp.]|uniref:GntR family transcriptional regulator n=1 Tax=uncultured Enterovirga sp. TaxID=2026352 RepID=UPI0035CB7B16
MSDSGGLPHTIPYFLAEKIKGDIIRWRFPPGSNLREVELGAEFGSSRGPVREAFRILELQGLVVHSPRRGFRVRKWQEEELRQLYRLRAQLEGEVIDVLAGKDVGVLADALDRINADMLQHALAGAIDAYFSANIAFHQRIIDAAESAVLSTVMNQVNAMSLPARYLLMLKEFSGRPQYDYHSRISTALRDRNFPLARKLTTEHVTTNLSRAIEIYFKALEAA